MPRPTGGFSSLCSCFLVKASLGGGERWVVPCPPRRLVPAVGFLFAAVWAAPGRRGASSHPGVAGSIPTILGLPGDDVTPAAVASGGTGCGAALSPGHTCHRLRRGAAAASPAAVSSAGFVEQGPTWIHSLLHACAGTIRAAGSLLHCSAARRGLGEWAACPARPRAGTRGPKGTGARRRMEKMAEDAAMDKPCLRIVLSPSAPATRSATSAAVGRRPRPLAPRQPARGGEGDPPGRELAWQSAGKTGGGRENLVSVISMTYFSSPQLANRSIAALSELPYEIPGGEERFLLGVYPPAARDGEGGRRAGKVRLL